MGKSQWARNLGRGKGRGRGLVVETVIKMNEKQ